jgi:hypothetical protein
MVFRRLSLPGAFALTLTLAGSVPVFAQAVTRTPAGIYDRYDEFAYDNGYNAGAREGERDARDDKAYGFKRDSVYQDADTGFRGGDKDRYRFEFRRGYEVGYYTGYRRFAHDGFPSEPPPDFDRDRTPTGYIAVPVPAYHTDNVNARIAYENGYRDGAEEGRKDFERHRSYEPTRRDRYRDGDHGFEDRYGSRDAYKADYRSGFRAGYEEAYRVR